MLLKTFCFLVGYRFHDFMSPTLRLPYEQAGLDAREIREKARASAAVVGIFLGFLVALAAALVAAEKTDVFDKIKPVDYKLGIAGFCGALFTYLALREQRKISAAHWEATAWQEKERPKASPSEKKQIISKRETTLRILHVVLLVAWLIFYLALFAAFRLFTVPSRALGVSALILVAAALMLLIFSVELYDAAGGWQFLGNTPYNFHMASLAGHCYLLGLAMTIVGFSLLLSLAHFRTGYWLSFAALILLLALTSIERQLGRLAP